MIVFVQPFGLNSPGGGPRILRALLEDAPSPCVSVCTSPQPPPPTEVALETHSPMRPYFGYAESSRIGRLLDGPGRLWAGKFRRQLATCCREYKATGLHSIAHSLDFWHAYQVAQELKLRYYLSIHDDLDYALQGRPEHKEGMKRLGEVWRGAQARFVISEEMGQEYSRRYGVQSYTIITDGLTTIASAPLVRPLNSCRIYFMGLFHWGYRDNMKALLSALALLQQQRPDITLSVTFRCGSLPTSVLTEIFPVEVLPFGSEQDVVHDMKNADILYLPLPFETKYEKFVRCSLSTKMVTYLGSGLPILYHGPEHAAACRLLANNCAAITLSTLNLDCIAAILEASHNESSNLVQNALALGHNQFWLQTIRSIFWQIIEESQKSAIT